MKSLSKSPVILLYKCWQYLRVNITVEGKRNLGAVIGSTEYFDEYVKDLVKDWNKHLAFASRFKSKLNYFLRTITNIRYLLLLLERTIRNKFIPAVTGGHICSDKERVLFSLPTRHGGLVISIFHETAKTELMNPSKITSQLAALI